MRRWRFWAAVCTVIPPPPPTYTVGGTVTGLAGSGLVLALNSNFGGDRAVSASGSFTFGTRLPVGSTFSVEVKTQPTSPGQYCEVANSDGAIVAANVTDVTVTCGTGYTVGGTVSGLVGSGLTLATCHSVSLRGFYGERCNSPRQVGANGAFALDSVYPAGYSGSDYVVITQQPSSPTQHCVIGNAAVSIQNANDTSVTVSCAGFSYVTNAADNTLSAYSIDATTGALAVIGAPTTTGASPHAAVGLEYYFGQDKRYVFVGNEGSNDVSAFAVNSTTGALTAVPGSPFPAGTDPQAMLFAGSYLYVANAGSDSVSAYTIDASTGALAPLSSGPSTIATGKTPTSIVTFNGNVFVANHGGSNDISVFSMDTIMGTGVLTPVAGSPFLAGGNPLSLAVGGVGTGDRFLYTANPDATHPSISGFSIDRRRAIDAAQRLSISLAGKPLHRYRSNRRLPVCHVGREHRRLCHRRDHRCAYAAAGIPG